MIFSTPQGSSRGNSEAAAVTAHVDIRALAKYMGGVGVLELNLKHSWICRYVPSSWTQSSRAPRSEACRPAHGPRHEAGSNVLCICMQREVYVTDINNSGPSGTIGIFPAGT